DAGEGLFDNYVSQIIPDDAGWLWFVSDHGIFRVRQKDFEAVGNGKLQRVQSIHFGQNEGAENLQANFGYSPGGLCDRDGRLWMPMRTGLAMINPKLLQRSAGPLPVLLQAVKVDDRVVARCDNVTELARGTVMDLKSAGSRLQLPPDYRRLEIDFTALGLGGPGNIQFRYRLVGLDKDW